MEKYYIVKVSERTSKTTQKKYFVADVVMINDYSSYMMNIMINAEQAEYVNSHYKQFSEISDIVTLAFNSYQKQYQLKLNIEK